MCTEGPIFAVCTCHANFFQCDLDDAIDHEIWTYKRPGVMNHSWHWIHPEWVENGHLGYPATTLQGRYK